MVGEYVELSDRRTAILAIVPLEGSRQVFNLEVNNHHVFRITAQGLLVHNNDGCGGGDELLGTPPRREVPDDYVVVKGGTKPPPPPGEVFSTSFGKDLKDASAGVPHGQVQETTAKKIRDNGGTIDPVPELTGGVMNHQHANVKEGSTPTVFQPPIPNPVPRSGRIGGKDYGK